MISAERKLTKAKLDVMRSTIPSLRLWAGVMSIGTTRLCDKTRTAYTNGRDEVYGRAFVEQLPTRQLSFVCLHEAVHKGLRHLKIWRKLFDEDANLANRACDYVVNRIIVEADPGELVVQFPRNPDGTRLGLYDPKYTRTWSARMIFDDLKQQGDSNANPTQPGDGGEGFDEHGWDDADELPKEEQEALAKEIDSALRRGEAEAKSCGAGKGGMPSELNEILRPQIDWREALREFISQSCASHDTSSWRRLNRRFYGMDLLLPTPYGESLGHIVVGADLSGSMWCGDPSNMQKILSEFVAITRMVNPQHVDLLYWDSQVTGHEEYKQGDYDAMLSSMKPRGGGGTRPSCVPTYLKEKAITPDCIVMLTDGEVFNDWGGNWPAPVLWVVCGNPGVTATTGKTIHMS